MVLEILHQLEPLGSPRTKKQYINGGAKEPVFGVTVANLKPIAKKHMKNQQLANELFATENYDAMYLAGMIADAKNMTAENFEDWIDKAYFYMISDYIVSVTLAESPLAIELAVKWIDSGEELKASAGWSALCWLLGVKADNFFNANQIKELLDKAEKEINNAPDRAKYSMSNFIIAVGVSFKPLHEYAIEKAKNIGKVSEAPSCKIPYALEEIEKAIDKGRIGFKRKNVRC